MSLLTTYQDNHLGRYAVSFNSYDNLVCLQVTSKAFSEVCNQAFKGFEEDWKRWQTKNPGQHYTVYFFHLLSTSPDLPVIFFERFFRKNQLVVTESLLYPLFDQCKSRNIKTASSIMEIFYSIYMASRDSSLLLRDAYINEKILRKELRRFCNSGAEIVFGRFSRVNRLPVIRDINRNSLAILSEVAAQNKNLKVIKFENFGFTFRDLAILKRSEKQIDLRESEILFEEFDKSDKYKIRADRAAGLFTTITAIGALAAAIFGFMLLTTQVIPFSVCAVVLFVFLAAPASLLAGIAVGMPMFPIAQAIANWRRKCDFLYLDNSLLK